MKTAPGLESSRFSRLGVICWNDSSSAWLLFVTLGLTYIFFFKPVLRFDGIQYMAPARSLVIDGNMNTYDEGAYVTRPGWADASKRVITGYPPRLVSYVTAPDYTPRGYRYVVFPVGNAMTWLPPIVLCHCFMTQIGSSVAPYAPDGFSLPYRLALGWWSYLIGSIGLLLAYKALRIWFSPAVSCVSAVFVFASGNLIQFLTRDVTFSHSIDFFLINAACLLFLKTGNEDSAGHESRANHALWGMVIGLSCIVRYQDIVLIILPLWRYIFQPGRLCGSRWRNPSWFLAGLSTSIIPQIVYWRLLYGTWLISGEAMGAAGIPSFQPLQPHVMELLFSRFHGLFNWMPWMLPLSIAYLLFIRRNRRFGLLLLVMVLIQTYYIASRSEWWNLGFCVRRYSGWSLFFMLGAAEIVFRCNRRWLRTGAGLIMVIIVSWSWLFQVAFHSKGHSESVYKHLIKDASPHYPSTYLPVIPSIDEMILAARHLKTWLSEYSALSITENRMSMEQSVPVYWVVTGHFLFLILIACCIKCSIKASLPTRVLTFCLSGYLILFTIWMIISDIRSVGILVNRLAHEKQSVEYQKIRIPGDSIYWGENVFLEIRSDPLVIQSPKHVEKTDSIGILVCRNQMQAAVIRIRSIRGDVVICDDEYRLEASTQDDVKEVKMPWMDLETDSLWYFLTIGPVAVSADDAAWEIRCSEGEGVRLAGFWYYPA